MNENAVSSTGNDDAPARMATPAARPMILSSRACTAWMAEQDCSLTLTTYQAGRLVFIGAKPDVALRAPERLTEQCQGSWTDGRSLWTISHRAMWRFGNDLAEGSPCPAGWMPASCRARLR